VFVDDLDAPVLADDDRHHLGRALRLRAGDALTLSDGRGRWRWARFGAELEPDGEVVEVASPSPPVTVGLAPVKGQRPEWAVQKLTELGVDEVLLLVADRSVVRWDGDRAASTATRLQRVAREAAMQSRRCTLPSIEVGVRVAALRDRPGVALAHPGGEAPSLARACVLVGPEGGWSESEVAAAPARVGLGPTVLRAETAAVVAGSLLVALRSGLVGPAPGALNAEGG
jgi:16S rRNA (uracil1498-N3)-methyltransferase